MINESFDGADTPMGKKRKRDNLSRFVSSTPIKLANKENFQFSDSLCMEVKSIAELVAERNNLRVPKPSDFEVIRKPPKKKKKSSDCCFVNSALDLKMDEKVINPFEVVRSDNTEAILLAQGFSNAALDVAVESEPATVNIPTNPFEVVRETELPKDVKGIDNSALELVPPPHTPLMLPLPFTPTVNHRIDFSNMPEKLTPRTLLASKLVLENNDNSAPGTPKRSATVKSCKSLSVISEEVEIDIGEELDNYQLQLENSINEAKMQNRKFVYDAPKTIFEEDEEPDEAAAASDATYTKEILKIIEDSTNEQQNADMLTGLKESDVDGERFIDDNNDVQFEEVDSFDEDFGKLGQFKRAYRSDIPATFKRPTAIPSEDAQPKKMNLGGSIRRSIRKLISHKSSESSENEKHEGIFQTIRHSLRRKAKPKTTTENLETTMIGRSVFRETFNNDDGPKKSLERGTLKRHVVKTMKTFMESVEEFDHY